jgi:hypothetical protein
MIFPEMNTSGCDLQGISQKCVCIVRRKSMQRNSIYRPLGGQRAPADVPDKDNDLISVLYHALESAQICARSAEEASQEGDQELAQFFGLVQQNQMACAQKAKQLLGRRLGQSVLH